MGKPEKFVAPKPPRIPTVGEKLNDLDGWIPSEDPHEGNEITAGHGEVIDCGDDDCDDCPPE
jgi:hypothetical protein